MDGQGYSANDKPCPGPRQEVSKFSAECNQTSSIATDPKEIVSYKKPHTEVEFTMDNKGAKCREETFSDDEDIAEHNISKIRSEEYSQPLDNMLIHTKRQNDEKIKDQWSPAQVISSKTFSNTMNYRVHPAVEPTMPNSIDNVSETFYLNQEVTSATFTTMSSAALNRLKHKKETYTTPSDERIPYSVNIWDYGGQNEFIITNQLFLNVEAFILMVMDISLDLNIPLKQSSDAEGKFSIPKTPAQILHYWLNAIHILAMEKTTEPNIALVLTHQDMIKADDANRYIDSYIEELLECIHGKPYASYIKEENIFVVDNREGTEDDFAHIRNRIFAKIAQQESWGIERPNRWLKLEADILETAKETEKPYLHISSVKDLASHFTMNERELKFFLSFHHNLGDLIYYPDKKLNDFIVTTPQWLLDMFKTLITTHEFLNRRQLRPELLEDLKRAIVSEDNLKVVWEGNDVQFLKDVMIKFDLMLPLGSEQKDMKYLIPCMLPGQEVKLGGPDPFTGMALIYSSTLEPEHGDAMPVGAFHRLLSQCSKTTGWTLCADEHLSYNQALIEIDDGVRMELSLQKRNSVNVSIWSFREKLDDGYLSINEARNTIARAHKTTAECMKKTGLTQKGSFKMLCPHWNPGEEYICLVTIDEKKEVLQNMPIFLSHTKMCTMHRKELEPGHFPWTKENFDSDGKF